MSESSRCLIRGSINVDEFFHVKDIVRPGETISSHGLSKRAGGKGANQAVAVAKAGASADLVGAVGEDGAWVKELLKESGVNVDGVEVVKESTGRAIIQLADYGENSIILFKGANFAPIPSKPVPTSTTHILLQNEIPLPETLRYISLAASSSPPISTIFNPSPMPSDNELRAFPWDKLTWLIVNEGEASDLYAVLADSSTTSDASSSALDVGGSGFASDGGKPYSALTAYTKVLQLASRLPETNIVCTLGSAGVLALVRTASSSHSSPEIIFLPAAKLQGGKPVDTTGAGDCFTGYMVAGLMQLRARSGTGDLTKEGVEGVLKRCAQAAGMCVEKRGAMESIPLSKEVDERLSALRS